MYDIDREMMAFAMEVLPEQKTILDIEIDNGYLLEVLPQNVYNI
ncbi:hypothetical protein [Faecalicatena contorta]|nr:hypothetical protein [Faecalicatena contorta]